MRQYFPRLWYDPYPRLWHDPLPEVPRPPLPPSLEKTWFWDFGAKNQNIGAKIHIFGANNQNVALYPNIINEIQIK